jgi:hypothetical protein
MSTPQTIALAQYLVGQTLLPPLSQFAALGAFTGTELLPDGSYTFDLGTDYAGSQAYIQSGLATNDPSYVTKIVFSAAPTGSPADYVQYKETYGDGSTGTFEVQVLGGNGQQILFNNVDASGDPIANDYSFVSLNPQTLVSADNAYDAGTISGSLTFSPTGLTAAVNNLSGVGVPIYPVASGTKGYYATANAADVTETSPTVFNVTTEQLFTQSHFGKKQAYLEFSTTGDGTSANPNLTTAQIALGEVYQHFLNTDNSSGGYLLDTIVGWSGSGANSVFLLGQGPATSDGKGGETFAAFTVIYDSLQTSATGLLEQNITFQPTDTLPSIPPCFAAGTRIRTVRGEVAVEDLAVGDAVLTVQDGESATRKVVWIGSRRVNLAAHPAPHTVRPIRILRDAFAADLPSADLVVSPDHALFVDGTLIAARLLVNGATIVEDMACHAVQYFHVELDQHAVLFAESLPAESYLDTGNRAAFENGGTPVTLHPDFSLERRLPGRAASCAPFAVDEATVKPVWDRLIARAAALGFAVPAGAATSDDPALTVIVMGCTMQPASVGNGRYSFVLPAGAERVTLASRAARPSAMAPWLDDRRELGVAVSQITLRDGASAVQDIAIDHPGLTEGWWAVERDATGMWRWTNGRAVLDLPAGAAEPRILEIRLAGGIAYPVAQTLSRAA